MKSSKRKVRAYQIARQMELSWTEFELAAEAVGHPIASTLNTLEQEEADALMKEIKAHLASAQQVEPLPPTTAQEQSCGWFPSKSGRFPSLRQQKHIQRSLRSLQHYVPNPHLPVRRQTMQQCRYRR